MTVQARSSVLDRLGKSLNASVLAYVTGDRAGLDTQIAAEQLPRFRRHLDTLGKSERIALVLHTRGGDVNTPWPLVNFLREHCEHLTVLVPFVAHSAGTLISLGADEIMMTRFATISPIDPTVANLFNPQDPVNAQNRLPIAVEDVMAFLELAENSGGNEARLTAFTRLADSVHPLALGNVRRSINQIRKLAGKMLALAASPPPDPDQIVAHLTTEFYSHLHLVNRREATEIGLPVTPPSDEVETLLLEYYDNLCADLQLLQKWDPVALLRQAGQPVQQPFATPPSQPTAPAPPGTTLPGIQPPTPSVAQGAPSVSVALERGYIETVGTSDVFMTRGTVNQQVVSVQMAPGMPTQGTQNAIAFEIASDEWEIVK